MATNSPSPSPLASQLRPTRLGDFLGQTKLVGPLGPLRHIIESGHVPSMIFWGPPASGKTTLSRIIAHSVEADFISISAVMDGKDEFKRVIQVAAHNQSFGKQTILFIDEIHRWNKAQQDALLPYVEDGRITLIGATTENPSFEINSALLSRCQVFVFETHLAQDILIGLYRGLDLLQPNSNASENQDALTHLAELSNGDMRLALNSLELSFQLTRQDNAESPKIITREVVEQALQKFVRYDKGGEEHYNIISAVHKSLRSSNASAAVYWIQRMLIGGEDPVYIARRLLRFASEDIGNAAPNALLLANAVFDTCSKLGMPECDVALTQLAEFLAKAPKNNQAYTATNQARQDARAFGNLPVPLHLRNAPTKLMKQLNYGKNYEYDHNLSTKKSNQQCFPDELIDRDYFTST